MIDTEAAHGTTFAFAPAIQLVFYGFPVGNMGDVTQRNCRKRGNCPVVRPVVADPRPGDDFKLWLFTFIAPDQLKHTGVNVVIIADHGDPAPTNLGHCPLPVVNHR